LAVYNSSFEVVCWEFVYEMEETPGEEVQDEDCCLVYNNTRLSREAVARRCFKKEIVGQTFKKLKGAFAATDSRVTEKARLEPRAYLLSALCDSGVHAVTFERQRVL
jgi:hypothetical protein